MRCKGCFPKLIFFSLITGCWNISKGGRKKNCDIAWRNNTRMLEFTNCDVFKVEIEQIVSAPPHPPALPPLQCFSSDALNAPCPCEAGVKRPKATWEPGLARLHVGEDYLALLVELYS